MNRIIGLIGFVLAVVTLILGSIGCADPAPQPAPTFVVDDTLRAEEKLRKQSIAEHNALVKRKAQQLAKLYEVSEQLNTLPSMSIAIPKNLTWQEAVGTALHYSVDEPMYYNERWFRGITIDRPQYEIRNQHIGLMVAYGIFQTGNSPVSPRDLKEDVSAIFENAEHRTLAYRLALPSIRLALQKMPADNRSKYLRILRHTRSYLTTFNLKREDEYLTKLRESKDCVPYAYHRETFNVRGCEERFTQTGPYGDPNPYRKMEAFVYRRVKNDGWSIEVMKTMLDRLLADLS